jgi:hypothetical protein
MRKLRVVPSYPKDHVHSRFDVKTGSGARPAANPATDEAILTRQASSLGWNISSLRLRHVFSLPAPQVGLSIRMDDGGRKCGLLNEGSEAG